MNRVPDAAEKEALHDSFKSFIKGYNHMELPSLFHVLSCVVIDHFIQSILELNPKVDMQEMRTMFFTAVEKDFDDVLEIITRKKKGIH